MDSHRKISILYGSQTGTAQAVAERVSREAKRLHYEVNLSSMDDYKPIGHLIQQKIVVFVCSTTGQGDEPDNMKAFWKFLLRKTLPLNSLEQMNFGVLGLGDSSYQKYNYVGKRLHKRLLQLGGNALIPLGLGDEQHDLGHDHVIDPWLRSFWEQALAIMPLPEGLEPIPADVLPPSKYKVTQNLPISHSNPPSNVSNNGAVNCDNSRPIMVPLISCNRVTSEDHFQDTRLVELDIRDTGITFQPGDVCMMRPNNLKENIDFFFQIFPNLNPETSLFLEKNDQCTELPSNYVLPNPCLLKDCVEKLWDIQSIPGRYFFELMSHFSPNDEGGATEKEKLLELSSAEGQQELYEYCNRPRRNILEVLYDFRFTTPNIPLEYLFDLFPCIKPRAFSIASSIDVMPNKIQLLIAVVRYKTKLLAASRLGLCSNWLTRLEKDSSIAIWIKKGTLSFPSNPNHPVVMVGPGTGIAPFRAYASKEMLQGNKSERQITVFLDADTSKKTFTLRVIGRKCKNSTILPYLQLLVETAQKTKIKHMFRT